MYMPLPLGCVAVWESRNAACCVTECGLAVLQVQVHRLLGAPWCLLSRILLLHSDLAHLGPNRLWKTVRGIRCSYSTAQDEHVHHTWNRQVKRIATFLMRFFFACSIGFTIPVEDFGDKEVWGTALALFGRLVQNHVLRTCVQCIRGFCCFSPVRGCVPAAHAPSCDVWGRNMPKRTLACFIEPHRDELFTTQISRQKKRSCMQGACQSCHLPQSCAPQFPDMSGHRVASAYTARTM